jgi:hypothetical protein
MVAARATSLPGDAAGDHLPIAKFMAVDLGRHSVQPLAAGPSLHPSSGRPSSPPICLRFVCKYLFSEILPKLFVFYSLLV